MSEMTQLFQLDLRGTSLKKIQEERHVVMQHMCRIFPAIYDRPFAFSQSSLHPVLLNLSFGISSVCLDVNLSHILYLMI